MGLVEIHERFRLDFDLTFQELMARRSHDFRRGLVEGVGARGRGAFARIHVGEEELFFDAEAEGMGHGSAVRRRTPESM